MRRLIVAHLGGGARMCAMLDGHSVGDTTMDFGAMSGPPMATRSAICRRARYSTFCAEDCLTTHRSKRWFTSPPACSAYLAEPATLQQSTDPRAIAAVEAFVYAMTKYAGAYTVALGGLDAFVFTAGIGEHSAAVRTALYDKLAWLGVKLDAQANAAGAPRISTANSRVSVWVIPTNKELMIAQHTLALLRP
jgi:acetate kinase